MCNAHREPEQASAPAPVQIVGTTFAVSDMTCNHCVGTIRTALGEALPDSAVAFDLGARRVTVAGNPDVAEQAIRDAGYEPVRTSH